MAEQGERLFVQYHCAGCHRGSQIVHAPQLEGVYGRPVPIQQGRDVQFTLADERYIRDSILRPKQEVVAGYEPVMPSFEGQISEQDLLKIIAYIKSIGAKEATR
jgi:cytochrome c oxidase subunit 2